VDSPVIAEQLDVSRNVVFGFLPGRVHHVVNSFVFQATEEGFGERVSRRRGSHPPPLAEPESETFWGRADVGVVSTPVDLPADAGLVRALRAVNAVSDRPTGSPFTAVFEHIIAAALDRGSRAIVTGDGGDEVFTEREEVLVHLLAARSPTLPAAVGYFVLRNGERGTATLYRAACELATLTDRVPPRVPGHPSDVPLGPELARHVVDARGSALTTGRDCGGRVAPVGNRLVAAGRRRAGVGAHRRLSCACPRAGERGGRIGSRASAP
jgi:hypothetical protein